MSQKIELTLTEDSEIGRAGQMITLALTPSDVHIPQEMPTYLAGFDVPGFRADEVSKVILVDKDEDKFRSVDSDDAFKPVHVKASLQAPVPEVDPKTNLASYKVVERFLGSFIPTQTELNADGGFRPKQAAARRIKRAIQIDRELDVWTLLTTTGSWNGSNVIALGSGFQWNGGEQSNPIANMMALAEGSMLNPVDYWMALPTANAFLRHTAVRDYFKFMNGDQALANGLQNLNNAQAAGAALDFTIPGIGTVHVVTSKYKNASGALVSFLGTAVVATHSPPGTPQDGEDMATTYTFRRKGPSGTGYETREFFVDGRGPLGGTMLVASMADVAKMTGPVIGGLLTGAYQ